MIKRLRAKFILTNMLLVTIVLIVSLLTIDMIYTSNIIDSGREAMREIARSNSNRFDYIFSDGTGTGSKYSYFNTFIIEINEYSRTYTIDGYLESGALVSDEQSDYINKLINSVLSNESNEGVLEEFDLRFYYVNTLTGKKIVFLDKNYEKESIKHLIVTSVVIGLVAEFAFSVISIILSRVAVKPVEKSIKQQQQLVADVSHELKTPITVISTNADIVMSHPDSPVEDQSKWLGYIKDEAERMSDLVNNMLYLAKVDERESKIRLEDIDLSAAAYEASLPFESVFYENRKSFEIDISKGVFARADHDSVKHLISIMLDNANKYSNDGGNIVLKVFSEPDKAVISVFNTGDPIPKDCISHIFERFYRVDKSRSREQGGSGLGLSIAKHIIEENEGSISVSSSEENGTTFTCCFKPVKKQFKQDKSVRSEANENEVYFD